MMRKNPPFQHQYAKSLPPNAWKEQYAVHPMQRPETEVSQALEATATPAASIVKAEPGDVPIEMITGMKALLALHNTEEMRILCNELGLKGSASKGERIMRIFDAILSHGEKAYRDVLGKVWEGIQIEYLRSLGKKIRSYKLDPRALILQHWTRRGEKDRDGWCRVYVPVTDGLPEEETTSDKTIASFLSRIRAREKSVKAAEREIRVSGSYTGTVDMLDGMARLRQVEEETRKAIIKELENTRYALFLCEVREAAMNMRLEKNLSRGEEIERRAALEASVHESAFGHYFEMAHLEKGLNQAMTHDYLSVVDRARDEHYQANRMREELEEATFLLADAEHRLFKSDSILKDSIEREKRASLVLEDTNTAFSEAAARSRVQKQRLRATNTLYLQMITDAEVERIAQAHRDAELRNEFREQAAMAFAELNQRRDDQLRELLATAVEEVVPKKGKKAGKKGKKGGKKGKKGGKKKKKKG